MLKAIALGAMVVTCVLVFTGCATTGYYGYGDAYPDYGPYAYPGPYLYPYPYGYYGLHGYYSPYGYYGPYRHDEHGHWHGNAPRFFRGNADHHPEFHGSPFGPGHPEPRPFWGGHPGAGPLGGGPLGGGHLGGGPMGGGRFGGGPFGGGRGGHR